MLIKFGFGRRFYAFLLELKKESTILIGMIISCIWLKFDYDNIVISLTAKVIYIGIIYMLLVFFTGEYHFLRETLKNRRE